MKYWIYLLEVENLLKKIFCNIKQSYMIYIHKRKINDWIIEIDWNIHYDYKLSHGIQ